MRTYFSIILIAAYMIGISAGWAIVLAQEPGGAPGGQLANTGQQNMQDPNTPIPGIGDARISFVPELILKNPALQAAVNQELNCRRTTFNNQYFIGTDLFAAYEDGTNKWFPLDNVTVGSSADMSQWQRLGLEPITGSIWLGLLFDYTDYCDPHGSQFSVDGAAMGLRVNDFDILGFFRRMLGEPPIYLPGGLTSGTPEYDLYYGNPHEIYYNVP